MEKIDLKDRKILYQLDQNSRQSFSQIGKKVGLTKKVVEERVNRLIEKRIITNFYTVVDSYKMGYMAPRFHFVYQYTTPEIERKIIEYFKKNNYVSICASTQGRYDLTVTLWVKDAIEFYNVYQEIQNKFRYHFHEQSFALYVNETHYKPSYIVLEHYDERDRDDGIIAGGGKKIELDQLDFKILCEISCNARLALSEIASNTKTDIEDVNKRLKHLIKIGVIRAFRTEINLKKLGFRIFKAYLYLKDYKIRGNIINYVKTNPYLVCVDTTACESDLELEFHLENITRFYDVMHDITQQFSDMVRNYEYLSVMDVHKYTYMPEKCE